MTDNAGDRKAVRAAQKRAEIDAANRASVVRNLMSTVEGRHWMWDLLAGCNVFSSTFTGEPLTTAFNEGQRAVGLKLLSTINTTCPDSYIQAQRESNERSTADERRRGPVTDRRDSGPSDSDDPDSDPDTYRDSVDGIWTAPEGPHH